MSKKLKLIIDTSQQQISESIDFSATDNKKEKIAKIKNETKAVYVPVRKDFIKVDRLSLIHI